MNSERISRRKALYIVLSILVAAAIWFFVDQITGPSNGPRTRPRVIADIPIEYINESSLTDRGLMLVEDGTDRTIDLTMEGTRWLVSCLDRDDIRVTVDLNNAESAGEQNIGYKIAYTDRRFSSDTIKVKDASIYSAAVNISELYSRTVEVRCELTGNVAEGFSAGQVQLSHNALEIQGQAADIDPVSYAKVTFDIGQNAEETVSQTLALQFYDKNDQALDSVGIHPETETVQATLPVFVTKELRLKMNFVDAPGARMGNVSYEIQPATITVSGDASKLKDVESITLDRFDLLTLRSGANTHTYPITVPEGCQNLSGVTRATLQIAFKDMASASVTTDRFQYRSLPEGRAVDILTQEMTVEIFGIGADVAAITGEDLTVTADLGDYGAALGTYTVPAVIETTSGKDIGVSGSYQVQVTIREPETEQEAEPAE
ncbi:CdaR family protein [Oscillibacter sp.]|uniref:CdaR family protein n=1 Tax=Oscillibacter sp. TaxID=1945593 RepID=UPI00261635A4|nr:CdaR family protein [Oscillibacter sp.]MDD3346305.1 CdaR family protein [Oscillibacter sp.]